MLHRVNKFYSWVGHRLREVLLLGQYVMKPKSRPVIFISVSDAVSGYSSELRGTNLSNYWRKKGINSIVLPVQLERIQRIRISKVIKPDIVIHQTFRHEDNDPKIYPFSTNIVDLDDADYLDNRIVNRMIERASICHGAIGGSRITANWLKNYVKETVVIWTGTPYSKIEYPNHFVRNEKKIVWATARPLFNSRDAEFIRNVLVRSAEKIGFEFIVIGEVSRTELVDYFKPVIKRNVSLKNYSFLPYHELLLVLQQCAIGLAPLQISDNDFNSGKSFGKILAYIVSGVPVIAADEVDHALFFDNENNGYVSNSIEDWSSIIIRLLKSPKLRNKISSVASADLQNRLSVAEAADRTLEYITKIHQLHKKSVS